MIPTYGLTHLQITVRDLARSRRFYQELLGMREILTGTHFVMLRTPEGHDVLTLNADPRHAADAGRTGGIAHFGFRLRERRDMEEVLEQVKRAGGTPIEHGLRGKGEPKELYAFATDPDGYEVELFWQP
jgi:catechol 2,3-dioxygenase-like lactoylglutathione lyase family enzyme